MKYDTSELCDIYQEDVNVVEPLFSNFGGRSSFGGQICSNRTAVAAYWWSMAVVPYAAH